jgi:hypothetical protein
MGTDRVGCGSPARLLNYAFVSFGTLCCAIALWPLSAVAQTVLPAAVYPVGMTQVEFIDSADGGKIARPPLTKCPWPPICTCIWTRRSSPTD